MGSDPIIYIWKFEDILLVHARIYTDIEIQARSLQRIPSPWNTVVGMS